MSTPGQGNDRKRKRQAWRHKSTVKPKNRASKVRKIVEGWLGPQIKHAPSEYIQIIIDGINQGKEILLPDGMDRISTAKILRIYLRYTKNLISAKRSRIRHKLYVTGLEKTIQTLVLSSKQRTEIPSLRTNETLDDYCPEEEISLDNKCDSSLLLPDDAVGCLEIEKLKIESEQIANHLQDEIRRLRWRVMVSENSLEKVQKHTNLLEDKVNHIQLKMSPADPLLKFSEAEEWWSKMFINVY